MIPTGTRRNPVNRGSNQGNWKTICSRWCSVSGRTLMCERVMSWTHCTRHQHTSSTHLACHRHTSCPPNDAIMPRKSRKRHDSQLPAISSTHLTCHRHTSRVIDTPGRRHLPIRRTIDTPHVSSRHMPGAIYTLDASSTHLTCHRHVLGRLTRPLHVLIPRAR